MGKIGIIFCVLVFILLLGGLYLAISNNSKISGESSKFCESQGGEAMSGGWGYNKCLIKEGEYYTEYDVQYNKEDGKRIYFLVRT